MILSPITAYRLAAQAERAHEALAGEPSVGGSQLDIKVRALIARLRSQRDLTRVALERNSDLAISHCDMHADLAEANAKIARMTSGLKRGASKRVPNADGYHETPEAAALVAKLNAP